MKNKNNTNSKKGGIYIAVCCFAVLAAAIGYVGRSNVNSSPTKPENTETPEIALNDTAKSQNLAKTDNDIEITVKDYEPMSTEKDEVIKEDETVLASKTAEVTENKFLMPVEGTVVCAFSNNELIYNKILSDWRTHNGIDISCEENSAIYASADGIVSDILDNSMGKSVVIDHQNGYVSVYSNLSEEIEVKSGDSVSAGTLIGKVSDSNTSDFTDNYHLHFEILYENEYVNPTELLS